MSFSPRGVAYYCSLIIFGCVQYSSLSKRFRDITAILQYNMGWDSNKYIIFIVCKIDFVNILFKNPFVLLINLNKMNTLTEMR